MPLSQLTRLLKVEHALTATMEGLMTFRRSWIKAAIVFGSIAIATSSAMAQKKDAPGVTDNEIMIGQTMPYSGPGERILREKRSHAAGLAGRTVHRTPRRVLPPSRSLYPL